MIKFLLLLTILPISLSHSELIYPISFTVVRTLTQPQSLQIFFKSTGCCQSDPNTNMTTGYNLVSLDGFSSTSTVNSIQKMASPLSMWMNAYLSITAKDSIAGNTTSSVQQYILKQFHQASSKLIFNALSNEAPVSATKINPDTLAQNIINVLKASQLDGVSIEFSDYHAVAKGTASNWLNSLLSALKTQMDSIIIVLIIPPTFVTRIPLFFTPKINSIADFFVLKYYDTNLADYNTYETLFLQSSRYPGSAFMQLVKNQQVWMDTCKTLIAKPTIGKLERTSGGFIDATSLSLGFSQFNSNTNWFGGFANLDFQSDSQLKFQKAVLEGIRNTCYQSGRCFCQSF